MRDVEYTIFSEGFSVLLKRELNRRSDFWDDLIIFSVFSSHVVILSGDIEMTKGC